ncbi:hypothetical protein GCM10027614_23490 [Micromonospora vulcania]
MQCPGERTGQDPQQCHEPPEEDRPDPVLGEALFGPGDLCGAEMTGKRRPSRASSGRPPRRPTAYPMESPTIAPVAAAVATHSGSTTPVAASRAELTRTISPGSGTPMLSTPITPATSR